MQKHITAADTTALRVVLITLDNHLAGAVRAAASSIAQDAPNVEISFHVAAQWSALDPSRLSFEIYVDGERVSSTPKPNLRDRDWKKEAEPFFLQLGSAVTGAGPLGWAIDEVRISSVPRYSGSFTPPNRVDLDEKATVVFHFDGERSAAGAV